MAEFLGSLQCPLLVEDAPLACSFRCDRRWLELLLLTLLTSDFLKKGIAKTFPRLEGSVVYGRGLFLFLLALVAEQQDQVFDGLSVTATVV